MIAETEKNVADNLDGTMQQGEGSSCNESKHPTDCCSNASAFHTAEGETSGAANVLEQEDESTEKRVKSSSIATGEDVEEKVNESRENDAKCKTEKLEKQHVHSESRAEEKRNVQKGECRGELIERKRPVSSRRVSVEIDGESEGAAFEEQLEPESESNFHEAVRSGDAGGVAAMIARGAVQDLDEPDWDVTGDPPLLVAATKHCLPVVSILLENGCDPTVRSPRGETALHRAIQNGGPGNVLKFVEKLLNHGCPASVKEAGGGLTALHILTRQLSHTQISKSTQYDFDEALKTLELLAKAGPVDARDHHGRSALHILASSTAFDNNHASEMERLIKILLDAGADPASTNDRGETPLHESLECGALNTASLLVQYTPVGIASRYGETPLHIAAKKNYADMVTKLIEHGEDPSVQDAGGNTPLHLASARGFHEVVSILAASPLAQLEKTNNEGLTSLQVATESGFANAVRLLLQAGADPSRTATRTSSLRHRHPDITVLIDHELTRRRQLAA